MVLTWMFRKRGHVGSHRICVCFNCTLTDCPQRIIAMRRTLSMTLTLLALIGAAPLLAACHTAAGAGQDISNTGQALTNSADQNTP